MHFRYFTEIEVTKLTINKKSSSFEKKFIPFSKKNVIYARIEAYIFSLILIVMVCFKLDVTPIAILLSLAWSGYKLLQVYYIWLCKHEHLLDKKIEYCKLKLDTSGIDSEIQELENTNIGSEVI